ncbi:MAG: hypothetical protein KY475_00220 [Planctomycetes bacterium]|nr:hypothetical protein [Planctomycetota bacterium]
MDPVFDPYYRWLGIPPEEQPPDRYRLLGVPPFERDVEVIQNAVDRQMMHIRTFQAGPHSAESQRILNEIAAARACLLDPAQKAAYDRRLYAELHQPPPQPPTEPQPPAPAPVPTAYPVTSPDPTPPARAPYGPTFPPAPARRKTRRRRKSGDRTVREIVGVVVGGVSGVAIALAVLWYGFGVDALGVMARFAPRSGSEFVAEGGSDEQGDAGATGTQASRLASRDGAASRAASGSASASDSATTIPPDAAQQKAAVQAKAAPPAPSSPFAQLVSVTPNEWADGAVELGVVPPGGVERWQFSLVSDFVDLGGQLEFAMPVASSIDPTGVGWPIYLQPRGEAAPETQTLAATLFVEDGRLKLEANGEGDEAARRQLLNTIFSFTDGDHSRDLPLRQPDEREAVLLNLDEKVIAASLATEALPPAEKLVLHIAELEGFPAGVSADPAAMRLRIGDRAAIEISTGLSDYSAEIEVQFDQIQTAPEVRIRAWHREGDRREQFTSEHVKSEYAILQKKIAQDQGTLAAAQTALRNAESALRSVAARRPANSIEAANLRNQAIALQKQRTKAIGAIRRLTTAIPKMQAAVARLEAVARLGAQLHNTARIHFRVAAAAEGRELPLIHLTGPNSG